VLPEGMDPKNATALANGKWGNPNAAPALSNGPGGGGVTVITRSGSGSASGSGSGIGYGNASSGVVNTSTSQVVNVSASVDVTAGDVSSIDTTLSSVTTTLVNVQGQLVPKGVSFSSALIMSPGTSSAGPKGGFRVDGASGGENVFVIDGSEVTNFRSGALIKTDTTPLTSRAVSIASAVYPEEARAAKALGKVEVEVKSDRDGAVVSAVAVSGHKLLRTASESAARLSKFAPVYVNGVALRFSGTIIYDFRDAGNVEVYVKKMKAEPLSDEDKRAAAVNIKLHNWLYDVVARLRKNVSEPTANETRFVRDGKADIRIDLASISPDVLAKLKTAGFEPISEKGNIVTGRIAIEKLAALAEIEEVKLILPKI